MLLVKIAFIIICRVGSVVAVSVGCRCVGVSVGVEGKLLSYLDGRQCTGSTRNGMTVGHAAHLTS